MLLDLQTLEGKGPAPQQQTGAGEGEAPDQGNPGAYKVENAQLLRGSCGFCGRSGGNQVAVAPNETSRSGGGQVAVAPNETRKKKKKHRKPITIARSLVFLSLSIFFFVRGFEFMVKISFFF